MAVKEIKDIGVHQNWKFDYEAIHIWKQTSNNLRATIDIDCKKNDLNTPVPT